MKWSTWEAAAPPALRAGGRPALSCRDGGDTTAFYFHPHYSACDSLLRSHSGGKRIGLNGSLVSSVWLREYERNYDLIPPAAWRWVLPLPRKTFWCLKLHRFVPCVRNNYVRKTARGLESLNINVSLNTLILMTLKMWPFKNWGFIHQEGRSLKLGTADN